MANNYTDSIIMTAGDRWKMRPYCITVKSYKSLASRTRIYTSIKEKWICTAKGKIFTI